VPVGVKQNVLDRAWSESGISAASFHTFLLSSHCRPALSRSFSSTCDLS
jgi:hypothetical protein